MAKIDKKMKVDGDISKVPDTDDVYSKGDEVRLLPLKKSDTKLGKLIQNYIDKYGDAWVVLQVNVKHPARRKVDCMVIEPKNIEDDDTTKPAIWFDVTKRDRWIEKVSS